MVKPNYTVIIPTLDAAKTIERLLETLSKQSLPPEEILVVDSQSEDGTAELALAVPGVRVIQVKRSEFDHGGTRDMAIRSTQSPFVVLLTQDALPMDAHWAANLLAPFEDGRVAAVCGRQVAYPDARASEKAVRAFRYPASSRVWDKSECSTLGMNAFLLSDACAAYRQDAYEAVGGFEHPIRTNEDMLMAAQLLEAGHRLAYSAEAKVWHSHCYTLRQEYRRNRLIGECLAQYGHRFQGAGELGEGVKLARFVTHELIACHNIGELPHFWMNCGAQLLGNRVGRRCDRSDRSMKNGEYRQVNEPIEILMAVYNGEAYLREQLDSILNQSDDCGTGDSAGKAAG